MSSFFVFAVCLLNIRTVEQATATREAIYDLPWPPGNGSKLRAEFATDDEAKKAAEQHDLKRSTPTAATTPTSAPFGKSDRDTRGTQDLKDSRELRDSRNLRDSRDIRDSRDTRRPPPPPKKTLEDLFKKTVALPSVSAFIYLSFIFT
jgi:apoptotic chromatin condensation inducer in the nucleus